MSTDRLKPKANTRRDQKEMARLELETKHKNEMERQIILKIILKQQDKNIRPVEVQNSPCLRAIHFPKYSSSTLLNRG